MSPSFFSISTDEKGCFRKSSQEQKFESTLIQFNVQISWRKSLRKQRESWRGSCQSRVYPRLTELAYPCLTFIRRVLRKQEAEACMLASFNCLTPSGTCVNTLSCISSKRAVLLFNFKWDVAKKNEFCVTSRFTKLIQTARSKQNPNCYFVQVVLNALAYAFCIFLIYQLTRSIRLYFDSL